MSRSLLHCPMCGEFVLVEIPEIPGPLESVCENTVCVAYGVRYVVQGLTIGAMIRELKERREER